MITYHGCKCLNPQHKANASEFAGYPVIDEFTMNATYKPEEDVVHLKCHYCEYEATVDLKERPLRIENIRRAITIR